MVLLLVTSHQHVFLFDNTCLTNPPCQLLHLVYVPKYEQLMPPASHVAKYMHNKNPYQTTQH